MENLQPVNPSEASISSNIPKKTDSTKDAIIKVAMQIIGTEGREVRRQKDQAQISLHGAPKKSEESNMLYEKFILAEPLQFLGEKEKEEVFSQCLEHYQIAASLYEIIVAALYFYDPDANKFATEMCQRMLKIVEAHRALDEKNSPSTTSSALNTSTVAELKDKIIFSKLFGSQSTDPGSLGYNPLMIKKALKKGNLREQMTLAYTTIFSFLLDNVLKDQKSINSINEQLKLMNAGFQLNVELIEHERSAVGKLASPLERIQQFRDKDKGRIAKPQTKPNEEPKGSRFSEIPGLTLREARVALEDYSITEEEFLAMQRGEKKGRKLGARRVKWIGGQDLYDINFNSNFAKDAKTLGMGASFLLAGPSGTTDGFLHVAKYLGMEDQLAGGVKACIAWMIPTRDHSLHEVLIAASDYGFDYRADPQDFEDFFDPATTEEIRLRMSEHKVEMPAYYLSEAFQIKVAKELDLLEPKKG